MRRNLFLGLLVGALVAGLFVVQGGDASARPRQTLVFKEVTSQFYFIENPVTYPSYPGRGAGNEIVFTGELFDEGGGPLRGTNHGFCLTVSDAKTRVTGAEGPGIGVPFPTPDAPPRSLAQCQQTLVLPDGQIHLEGFFDQLAFEGDCAQRLLEQFCSGAAQVLAVTGGTGAYQGAAGQATLTQVEYPDVVRLVVELL